MPDFSVILVEPLYQRNMGSVARVMKNFNFRELVLVNPPEITMEAIAMSMHARDVLESAKIVKDFDDLRRDFDFLVATSAIVASDSNPLRTPIFPEQLVSSEGLKGKIGIVFGREDKGLSNDELKKCDLFVTIPAHHEYPTLNVAQSAAVILYEIYKFSKLKNFELSGEIPLKKTRKAGKIEKDVLLQKFDELVDSVDLRDFKADIAKKTFRTVIGRGFISGREAFTLIGVFRRAHKAVIKTKNDDKQ